MTTQYPTYEELAQALETLTKALAATGQKCKGDAPLLAWARERITSAMTLVDATRGNLFFRPARCLIAADLTAPEDSFYQAITEAMLTQRSTDEATLAGPDPFADPLGDWHGRKE